MSDAVGRARAAWENEQRQKAAKKSSNVDAAKDVLGQAAAGAVQGAVVGGGVPGAVVGSLKGAGLSIARNRTVQRWLAAALAFIFVVTLAAPLAAVFFAVVASSSGTSGNQENSLVAVEKYGIDADTAASVIDSSAEGIPWPLSLAIQEHTNVELTREDYSSLASALTQQGLDLSHGLNIAAGSVYNTTDSIQQIGLDDDSQQEQELTRTAVTAGMVQYGMEESDANRVYSQALAWTLGQTTGCGVPAEATPVLNLDGEQMANALIIIGLAKTMFPAEDANQAAVVGIATARQESVLRNIDYGDLDSLGLFQQRESWGTAEQRQEPRYATAKFFRALTDVAGWQQMPVTEAAQAVQVSAHPTLYAQWEELARGIVSTNFAAAPAIAVPDSVDVGDLVLPAAGVCQSGPVVKPLNTPYSITSYFGLRVSPGGVGSTNHAGVDFAATPQCGVDIVSASTGTVILSGYGARPGNWVQVDHGDWTSQYMHMLDGSVVVKAGDPVVPGQIIGSMGNTGASTGCHLHFGVAVDGVAVDPIFFMSAKGVQLEP